MLIGIGRKVLEKSRVHGDMIFLFLQWGNAQENVLTVYHGHTFFSDAEWQSSQTVPRNQKKTYCEMMGRTHSVFRIAA